MPRKHYALLQQEDNFEYFTYETLLDSHTLIYNPSLSILSRYYKAEPFARVQGEQQFTQSETALLLPLLRSYPYHASYELLLTTFAFGLDGVTDERLERARKHLEKAMDDGKWDREMRPIRNVMSRTRIKLHTLQIDILSILETGYMLHPYRNRLALQASHQNEMLVSEKA